MHQMYKDLVHCLILCVIVFSYETSYAATLPDQYIIAFHNDISNAFLFVERVLSKVGLSSSTLCLGMKKIFGSSSKEHHSAITNVLRRYSYYT